MSVGGLLVLGSKLRVTVVYLYGGMDFQEPHQLLQAWEKMPVGIKSFGASLPCVGFQEHNRAMLQA
jgi:hypothetical protein